MKKLTDNKIYDYIKFFEMCFRKNQQWRDGSLRGISINSQQLKRCFANDYKSTVIKPLIEDNKLRVVSDKYSMLGGKQFTKRYAITLETDEFYHQLKEREFEINPNRSRKRYHHGLDKTFETSYAEGQGYCNKDNRMHTPWCSISKEIRHNHVRHNGNFMMFDLDIECAYPSMIAELLNNNITSSDTLQCRRVPEMSDYNKKLISHIISDTLQCRRVPEEITKFNLLFDGDFYTNFIEQMNVSCRRDEMKRIFNTIINSNENQMIKYRWKLKETLISFLDQYPNIANVILSVNESKTYMGAVVADAYEKKIIKSLYDELKKTISTESDTIEYQVIYDGIEIWGGHTEENTELKIRECMRVVDSEYQFIKLGLK